MALPGTSSYPQVYYEDMHVTESQKNEEAYLKGNIDHWIASFVRNKLHIKTYRNYYNGIRDNRDFEYLTNNFGIGTPSKLKFTNLIKTRVDSLVSQLESDAHNYTVSCMDDKTIDIVQEQRKQKKIQDAKGAMTEFTNSMHDAINNEQELPTYSELNDSLTQLSKKSKTNFLSDFEIAAQRVCTYFEKSNSMGLRQKLAVLVHDLIVTGECYYRVYVDRISSDPKIEVVKPENFFHNKNTNTPFLEGTDAVVRREYLTHKEVASKYGKFMTKEQIKSLFGDKYMSTTSRYMNSGIDLDTYYSEDDPLLGQKHMSSAYTVEVVHVEWLATNEIEFDEEEIRRHTTVSDGMSSKPRKKARRTDRYEGTRIGGTLYVNCGKVEDVPRTQADPYNCSFSYGGAVNSDRGGKPYSVVGALKDVQDMYDLTMFYRDNLVANSGVPGDRVNVAGIPKVLGGDFMTRLFKFMALKKNGIELIDPTEHGAQLFQHYGGFDNSVNGQSLQAIDAVLMSIEHQAHTIAGTTPQMLGNVEERDAVSNVKMGVKNALMTNNTLFELFRSNHNRIIGALLSAAQITYRDGKSISYIAGAESYVFKINPEQFSFTDYAVSVSYASKDQDKLMDMKIMAKELIVSGQVDPDVMTKIILSDSIAEVSRLITEHWAEKKAEQGAAGGAEQAVEQLQTQLKEMESQLNNAKQQLEASKGSDSQLKQQELLQKARDNSRKLDIEQQKANDSRDYDSEQVGLNKERVQLEREQLYIGDGSAKEIKNQ